MTPPEPDGWKVWTTFVPLYRMCLHLVIADTADGIVKAREAYNPIFEQFDWDGEGAMCSWVGCEVGLFFRQDGLTHGEIAHEVLHATARILDFRGLRFDANNLEGYTYLLEWITNWVYQFIEPKKGALAE